MIGRGDQRLFLQSIPEGRVGRVMMDFHDRFEGSRAPVAVSWLSTRSPTGATRSGAAHPRQDRRAGGEAAREADMDRDVGHRRRLDRGLRAMIPISDRIVPPRGPVVGIHPEELSRQPGKDPNDLAVGAQFRVEPLENAAQSFARACPAAGEPGSRKRLPVGHRTRGPGSAASGSLAGTAQDDEVRSLSFGRTYPSRRIPGRRGSVRAPEGPGKSASTATSHLRRSGLPLDWNRRPGALRSERMPREQSDHRST